MKFKKPLAALAAALFAAAFIVSCGSAPKEGYDTFSLIMDRLAGAGNWSAKSHDESGGTLTVSGLTVKLPAMDPAPAAEEGQEAQPAAAGRDLEVATVEIKKLLDKKSVESILASNSWKDRKETKLADSVTLKGVGHKMAMGGTTSTVDLEELGLNSLVLAAAGADGPEGLPGYLRALRLASLNYKNFKVQSQTLDAIVEVLVASVKAEGVSFEGEPLPGLEAIDPSKLLGAMTTMALKSAEMKDMAINFKEADGKNQGSMSVAEITEKGVKGMGVIEEMALKGFKFDLTDEKKRQTVMTLEEITMNGFDMSRYMQKMAPFMVASTIDPDQAAELLGELQTIGDFFVSPFSVKDVAMRGLDVKLADYITIKMAEAKVTGPYRAGEIPLSQKSSVKGFEIILPEDGDMTDETLKEIVEFGRNFGMTRFQIEAEGEGKYDPAAGTITSTTTRFEVKDLADFAASFELGGLTPERIEKLNQTPLSMLTIAVMMPDAVFGDMSFNAFSLKLNNRGLVERLFDVAAKKEENTTGQELRLKAKTEAEGLLKLRGGEVLKDPAQLFKPVVDFLDKPEELEISLKAEPPFSLKSVMAMGGDKSKVLNSLNIRLSANGSQAQPLVFDLGGPSSAYGPGDLEDELDDEDEE